MNDTIDLPPEVLEALRDRNKILAIKRLREIRQLSLKEAKEAVDAYEGTASASAPVARGIEEVRSESNTGRLVTLIVVAVIVYGLYRYFSS